MKKLRVRLIKSTLAACLIFVLLVSNLQVSYGGSDSSAEKLNALGLLLNIEDDELSASLTRDIGLTMILKALGYTQSEADTYEKSSPFLDTEKWSKGWTSLAYSLEITTGTSETTFSPEDTLTEHEFLTFLLRALGYGQNESYSNTEYLSRYTGLISSDNAISNNPYTKYEAAKAMYNALSAKSIEENVTLAELLIEKGLFTLEEAESVGLMNNEVKINSVSVLDPHTIEVKFNQSVDSSQYFFNLKNDKAEFRVYDYWENDDSVAIVMTPADMAAGEYTLITQQFTSKTTNSFEEVFDVKEYDELKPVILSESLELSNEELLQFGLINTYGEMEFGVYENLSLKATSMISVKEYDVEVEENLINYYGVITDLEDEGTSVGDEILVELTYGDKTVSKTLVVVEDGELNDLTLYTPVITHDRLVAGSKNMSMSYAAMTKAGTSKMLTLHYANQDGVGNVETIDSFVFESTNPAVIDVDEIKVNASGELKFSLGNVPGVTRLSIYNKDTDKTEYISVAVYLAPVLSEVELGGQLVLIAEGETIEVDVVGYDQYGNQYDFGYISGLDVNSTDEDVIDDNGVGLMNNVLTVTGDEEGDSLVTVFNGKDDLLLSYRFSVEEAAEPHRIIEVYMPTLFEAAEDAVYELSYDDFYVEDQYSREYDLNDKDEIIIMTLDEDEDEIFDIGDGEITGGDLEISALDHDEDEDDDILTSNYTFEVDGYEATEFTLELSTVSEDIITSYNIDDVVDLEVGLANEVTLQLFGYNSDGEEIVIDESKISYVASSDTSLVTVTYDGTEVSILGEEGGIGGRVTVTIWSEGESIATSTVTVLEDPDNDDDDDD